ncbi:MAG: hypothetical protein RJA70_124 [Pseudomonadota bacterium]|jgi:hypothetical protein
MNTRCEPTCSEWLCALTRKDPAIEENPAVFEGSHSGRQRLSYSAKEFYVPPGSAGGWEAAMYDHYQALVKKLVSRLSQSQEGAKPTADTGRSTDS